MPHALIEVRRQWTPEQEVAIIDAVHAALVTCFQIPAKDKHIRLLEYLPHRFAVPADLPDAEFATIITIDCFSGRSAQAKRHLYAEIVERLEALGIPPHCVSILLRESDTVNWGIRGGQAASDIDLGFRISV